MKKLVLILVVMVSFSMTAQTKSELQKHFEAYYKQMKKQGDVQGVINAMTHLDVLSPNQARKDTLAYLYLSENKNVEALNTIGIEKNATDSDLNVEVKAIAMKALNEPKRSLEQYEVLFSRKPNPYLAYEMADLKLQVQDLAGAKTSIEYGLANVKPEMKYTFYERQQPYEASLKAAFTYLKALMIYKCRGTPRMRQEPSASTLSGPTSWQVEETRDAGTRGSRVDGERSTDAVLGPAAKLH